MFDPGASLRPALTSAERRLQDAEALVVSANTGRPGARSTDAAMAQTAQAAIFTEALLAAERARFAEIKAVAK